MEEASDASERASLMPESDRLLQKQRIKCPSLAVAHAPSIRQCRCSTSAVTGQPLVGRPQADSCMGRQSSERDVLHQMTTNQAFPTDDCQSGHAVTPRPWQPHTPLSAEHPGGTTHLSPFAVFANPSFNNSSFRVTMTIVCT
jgi:hypothetical protein